MCTRSATDNEGTFVAMPVRQTMDDTGKVMEQVVTNTLSQIHSKIADALQPVPQEHSHARTVEQIAANCATDHGEHRGYE